MYRDNFDEHISLKIMLLTQIYSISRGTEEAELSGGSVGLKKNPPIRLYLPYRTSVRIGQFPSKMHYVFIMSLHGNNK